MSKWIFAIVLAFGCAAHADDLKQDMKKTGKDVKQTAKDVGHRAKGAAREVGQGFKRGWKKIKGEKSGS